MTLPARTTYGWSGDGKTRVEIERDIDQTRYRLEADLQALQVKLTPRRLIRVAAAILAVGTIALIRRLRR